MCACSITQACLTLRPVDCSPPGSSVHGISQARILEWVAISYCRGSYQPRDRTHVSCISCTGRRILHPRATWETAQVFKSLGGIPRRGLPGSHGNSVFNLSRKRYQTVFQSGCIVFTIPPTEYGGSDGSISLLVLATVCLLILKVHGW